jgi:hypothetical protein
MNISDVPNIKFCEGIFQKNIVSNNVDEFGNFLSSILFCFFSLIHWHRLEKGFLRLSVPIAVNFIVGIGSVLFHAHGSRLFQFTDEIPMILTISYGIGIYHEELYYQKKFNKITYNIFQGLLAALQVSTIIANIYSKYFFVFEICFMTFCIWICVLLLVACEKRRNYAVYTILTGFFGYFFWQLDQKLCNPITVWMYFHAIWHICICITISNIIEIYKIIVCERIKIRYYCKLVMGVLIVVRINRTAQTLQEYHELNL